MSPHSDEVTLTSDGIAQMALNGNGVVLSNNGSNRTGDVPAQTADAPPRHNSNTAGNGVQSGNLRSLNGAGANGDGVSAQHVNGNAPHEGSNGYKSSQNASPSSPYLVPAPLGDEFDLICVGFGPASLAVAVAMHDALAAGKKLLPDGASPKVLFIEKQNQFAWHSGMLIPGAKMQISFIKDLASLRDPRSEFTFLNYLHRHDRLVDFTNLSTFLPARSEYEDYLRWCSSFFSRLVEFGQQVVSIVPDKAAKGAVRSFSIQSEDIHTGQLHSYRARHVLVASGGQPSLPKSFPLKHPRVIHSSQYANVIHQILPKPAVPYRVVVVGAGQSAAEIFHNVASRYPNSNTRLIMRQEFLRPSDDSPL